MVGRSKKDLIPWLDRIFSKYILDGSGKPKLKVHAFGITAIDIMKRYPWYSVDSSSWIQAAAFGGCITSKHNVVFVSTESPQRHTAGRHLTNHLPKDKTYLENMFNKEGFSPERLSTVYESRAVYNCFSFMKISKDINAENKPTLKAIQELF